MHIRYTFQAMVLLSWVFFVAMVSSKAFPVNRFAEGVIFICLISLGFVIALAIPHLWEIHNDYVKEKTKFKNKC